MLGLLDQMEAENPEDPSLAPKASACMVRWMLGFVRKQLLYL